MTTPTSTPSTALILWTERRDGYLHVVGAFGYDDGDTPSWGSYHAVRNDGLLFDGLQIVSQGNDADYHGATTDRRLYGWGVEYRNVFSLDLRDAEQRVRSLRVIERRLAKIRETQGHPKTLGQFVGQVAQAVRARTFYFKRDDETLAYRTNTYSVRRSIADAMSYVDNIVPVAGGGTHTRERVGHDGAGSRLAPNFTTLETRP